MTGFACQMQVISSKRGTLSPPAFKPIFNVPKETQVYFVTLNIGFMCRCVAYRSGMRTKAMPSACFFYWIFWLWQEKPSANPYTNTKQEEMKGF